MEFPRLSIITSVFKCEKFIQHFLEDVSRQTIFQECEIIILNANSPENEEKYILDFQRYFPRNVVYQKLPKRHTVYETWNIGIDLARAPILTNWNTDDRRAFNSLDLQLREFDCDASLDVCYGPTLITYTENESVEYCTTGEQFGCYDVNLQSMLLNNSPHCLPMWRKSLHKRFGYFDTKYISAADYEMWLRALIGGAKFKRIENIVGSYYRNPSGISSGSETLKKALEEVAEVRETYQKYL